MSLCKFWHERDNDAKEELFEYCQLQNRICNCAGEILDCNCMKEMMKWKEKENEQ